MHDEPMAEPTPAELDAEQAAERGTAVDLPEESPRERRHPIRDVVAAALLALAVLVPVTLVGAQPANAAVRCSVNGPSMRSDRTLDLLMSHNGANPYYGKPFAFLVKTRWLTDLGTYHYRNYRFSPVRHSHHTTTKIPRGWTIYRVEGGAFGSGCAPWVRR